MILKKDAEYLRKVAEEEMNAALKRMKKRKDVTFGILLKQKKIKIKSATQIQSDIKKIFANNMLSPWSVSFKPSSFFEIVDKDYEGFVYNSPDKRIQTINELYKNARFEIMKGNVELVLKYIEQLKTIG